jgi:RNA polymerase sigma factor (sigma-70 family)
MRQSLPTVCVVEDDAAMRSALDGFLRSYGFEVRLFASAHEFLSENLPETLVCLVLDLCLPEMSGLELQEKLVRRDVNIPIIFITGHGDIREAVRAIKAGAVEFLAKPFDHLDLLNAIQRSAGRYQTELQQREDRARLRSRFESLTPREQQIMRMVISGLLNKQIAAELGISEITVKIHRGHVMQKMEAGSLAELAKLAERLSREIEDAER